MSWYVFNCWYRFQSSQSKANVSVIIRQLQEKVRMNQVPFILALCCAVATDIQGRSQTSYTAPCKGVISRWLTLGVLGFFPTTRKNKCNTILLSSSCGISRHVYLHTQTTEDAGDIRTWRTTVILINGKTPNTPNLRPMPGSKWRRFCDLPRTCIVYLWLKCWYIDTFCHNLTQSIAGCDK